MALNVGRQCAVALVALWIAGCGKQPQRPEPVGEIRGTPINAAIPTNTKTAPTHETSAVQVARAPEPEPQGGYLQLGFDKLSGFNIEISDELLVPQTNQVAKSANDQIPQEIKELDQKKISLRGFMLPLKVEGGLVTELLIMKDQSMCCFGVTPKIHEWVSVKMKNGGVKPIMDEPVTLMGTLRVGETRENGYLVGIYSMDGHKLAERN
ncbi:MAG: DUF3299 domain-containing protein [Verrucomicrobia subdivision 3 bacterium]|nr:DUF3299 domain-containing protein [Limisphaerales bacterium]